LCNCVEGMVFTTLQQVLRQFVPFTDQNDNRDKGGGGEGRKKRRGIRKKGVTEGGGRRRVELEKGRKKGEGVGGGAEGYKG
jgi:hypothetical protein